MLALICMQCFGDLSRAIIFRNKCRETDELFKREIIQTEQATWSSELTKISNDVKEEELQQQAIEDENFIGTIKAEPEDSENFYFDEIPIRPPEVMMIHEGSSDIDEFSIEQMEMRSRRRERYEAEEEHSIFNCTQCDHVLSTKKTLKYHMAVKHGAGSQDFPCKVSLFPASF
jgi:hypothetical protein